MPARTMPGAGYRSFFDSGEDGWDDELNSDIRKKSMIDGGVVASRTTSLPVTGTVGDVYIVPTADSNGDQVAVWEGASGLEAWVYFSPLSERWSFWVEDEGLNVQWNGTAWVEFAGSGGGGSSPTTLVFGPAEWQGAHVSIGADVAVSAVAAAIPFDVEDEDVGDWHDNVTNNSRLTVPAGVTRVRVYGGLSGASATGQFILTISKNGTELASTENDTAGADNLSMALPALSVSPGDYFELLAFSSVNRNVTPDKTYFAIEAVEISTPQSGLPYDIRLGFSSTPAADQVLDTIVLPRDVTLPPDMSGSVGVIDTNPTASFVISVQDDAIEIGSITVSTSGVFTFATTGGTEQILAAGSVLTFVAPNPVDATAAGLSATLAGAA